MADHDPTALLTIVPSEIEAAIIVSSLQEEGIEAVQAGALTSGFRAEAPGGVRILVHASDLEVARKSLQELQRSNSEIDWSQVDVGEMEDD